MSVSGEKSAWQFTVIDGNEFIGPQSTGISGNKTAERKD
jgi:hypothetical protein